MNTHHGFRIFSVRGIPNGHVLGTVGLEAFERIRLADRKVTPAERVMTPAATISSSDRVADVLRLFAERRTLNLAVVDADHLVGTVTRFDVLRALRLQRLMASQHPGGGLAVRGHAT